MTGAHDGVHRSLRHHHHSTIKFGPEGATTSNSMGGEEHLALLGQSDAQCSGEAEGFACVYIDLASRGYALMTTSDALPGSTLGAHINDVRPAGSPPLTWCELMIAVELRLIRSRLNPSEPHQPPHL